jgi:hypothetical protein
MRARNLGPANPYEAQACQGTKAQQGLPFLEQPGKDHEPSEMSASAWFSAGAGTACTKHLFRLSRREAAVRARSARVLETILCPHAVPFTGLTRWSGNRGQLYAGSGEGQSSHFRSFIDPDVSGAGAGVQSKRCAARRFAMDRDRAQRRMGLPVMKSLDGLALIARVGRLAHPLPSLNRCEPLRVERLAPKQHVVDRTAELGRQNAQGFSLPVLLLKPREVLPWWIVPRSNDSRCRR